MIKNCIGIIACLWSVSALGGATSIVDPTNNYQMKVNADGSINTSSAGGSTSVTQGTIPWSDNIVQFGGNNLVTGTGSSGLGIPRITISNDSNILSTQSGIWTTGRTWNLLNTTDSVNSVQSGIWTTGRTWTLSNSTDSVNIGNFPSNFSVTQGTSPWIISGTVTSNQGTSPWVNNLTQFGGNNIVTGTGSSGLGIPRITISNDSNIFATQSGTWTVGRTWNLSSGSDSVSAAQLGSWTVIANQGTSPWVNNITQFGGSNVVTGTGASGSGIPRVTVSNDSNILATQSGPWIVTANAGTNLNTSALATSANQTNGNQITQVSSLPAIPAGSNAIGYLGGRAVLSTFTQSYSTSNLSTSAFTTIISSTSAAINEEDIFDNSGGLWYLAYAATCGALSNASNAVIIGPGGGGKDFLIPSGNCLGFEAIGSNITSGNVYMTFYK